VFGTLIQFLQNSVTSHARPLANGLSGIHCFWEDGFPPKTCGNDCDRYRGWMVSPQNNMVFVPFDKLRAR